MEDLFLKLKKIANPEKARILQRFFKTGKGEYGEGEVFLGISVPDQRKISKEYYSKLNLKDLQRLLESKIHEHRLIALIILIEKYKKANKSKYEKREIVNFYLKNLSRVNSWDLVDISAPKILGDFILKEKSSLLRDLAKSENLWERRISVVSTYAFIKKNILGETLAISEILLNDQHDLIHKAVGWMLRELGKRNKSVLELFLLPRYKKMPRTMLRYAIEKFSPEERKRYLKGEI
ncbi:DNA alkylation repair protein [Patescibacteria group bacterium]|nr:DNA alkylation repair protein [Patescibacteria group bacterium]